MGGKHPGFAAEETGIAKREKIPKENAGAILGAAAQKASASAKKKNPRLLKVSGVAKPKTEY